MKNFSKIVDNFDVTTKKYVDDGLAKKADSSDLSTVATSGSYNDLSNKPTIPDVSGKANLTGGNTFTGKQTLNSPASDGYSINAAGYVKGSWLQASAISNKGSNTGKVCVFDNSGWIYYRTPAEILTEAGGAKASDIPTKTSQLTNDSGYTTNKGTVTQVKINGATKSPDSAGLVDLGTVGGGGDNSKFDYTVLTNEDLNTVIEAGRYRGENGNTCKHKPFIFPTAAFFLTVEKTESGLITQTACLAADQISSFYTWSVRHSTNNGSSWSGWKNQQSMDNSASQVFSGIKTFDYIDISTSLRFNGSNGSNGQFAMSQGSSSAPKWVNLQVKVNGTIYTPDSDGLIDLGEISGGGGSASQYNDIY